MIDRRATASELTLCREGDHKPKNDQPDAGREE
jgi:hypothetical protein